MSRLPRFFISPDQVQGDTIALIGDDLRHIRTVLRKQPGDLLTVLDGRGLEYEVSIARVGTTEIITEIRKRTERTLPSPHIALGQGVPKSDKMDWIIQKATELGVASIVPLVTERTIVKIKDEERRLARWRKIAREAAMQSSRIDIPQVDAVRNIDDYLDAMTPGQQTLSLLPWEESSRPIKDIINQHREIERIVVLIGPEGGFSAIEAERAHAAGFQLVSLGPLILRSETAALTVISILQYEYGAS